MKLCNIDEFKRRYFHLVGTQFDNAIYEMETKFLVDAVPMENIDEMIAEIYSEHDKEIKDCGDNDCCLNCINQYTDRLMKVVFKYCKENTNDNNNTL